MDVCIELPCMMSTGKMFVFVYELFCYYTLYNLVFPLQALESGCDPQDAKEQIPVQDMHDVELVGVPV